MLTTPAIIILYLKLECGVASQVLIAISRRSYLNFAYDPVKLRGKFLRFH